MDTYKFGIQNQQTDPFITSGEGCYPPSVLIKPGCTFSSNGINVQFQGLTAGIDFGAGDYLHSLSTSECIRIASMCQDGSVNLSRPFSSNVASDPVRIVRNPKFSSISLKVTGQAAGIIQGVTFASGEGISSSNEEGLAPIAYDATGTEITISVLS